ncbi:DsbC family protein [Inmirania thermothiophila]|uniref:Thiol:disulfide interchange protein n=1 Tax=Inmirania thermothiophila TaxID=1750597 RepID=A0A3N1XUH0_9GAMM|nr:DsbC family protein [Inmirania thermothiophila]ROR29831.1 thiol:disulfide interchange protein DsbC [Inmirania thermothiophila]
MAASLRMLFAGAALALAAGLPVRAEEAALAAVRAHLARILPDRSPDRVAASPVPGLYEAVYGTDVFYITADGRYVLQGDLIDLEARANLTEQARAGQRRALIEQVPESEMIVYGPADARHTVTVFTDIDCPYCRRLHAQMAEYNRLGIRIRYLAFPRAGIGSESYRKAVAVWCAQDRRAAMTEAKQGRPVPERTCDDPVARHYRLGRQVGVTGTPALVREDGRMIPGYVPPQRLLEILERG